jgi:outer membrane protein assembly factor BamB
MLSISSLQLVLRTIAGSALLCLVANGAAAKHGTEDATSFQINPAHDGNVEFAAGFAAPLKKAWTYDTGGTVTYSLIAEGALYVVSQSNDLFAINLADGSRRWEHLLGDGANLGAYEHGKLFYNSGNHIIALRARNGRQLWSVGAAAAKGPVANNSTAPIAVKGTLYTGGFGVTAYDEETGAFKWTQGADATSSQVAYGDRGIYAGGPTQYFKFAAGNGSILWHDSGCCSGGGGIWVNYFRKHAFLVDWSAGNFALNSADGSAAGSFPGSLPPTFFASGKRSFELVIANGKLYCLDFKTGNVAWSFANNALAGQPIVVNGQPVVAAGASVYMLDGATGAQLWTDDAGGQITSMNAGDGVLAVTTGTKVIAYVPQ